MALDTSIKRAEKDSPLRCQGLNARGDQCMNMVTIDGERKGTHCSIHGGTKEINKQETASKNMYRLAKFGSRISEFSSHTQVKGLRDEIGILRMILEERLNKCQDNDELVLASNVISDLVMKIQAVVTSCHRLESSMGQLLDKQQLIQFAEAIITVICSEIQDADLLARLAHKIEAATEAQLSGVEKAHEAKKVTPMTVSLDG
jgi:hypothetical protein